MFIEASGKAVFHINENFRKKFHALFINCNR